MLLNVENILTSIKELLISYIHSILYHHQVYPQYIFQSYRSFNITVPKSRSPRLNHYIETLVDRFLDLLIHNPIENLAILLYSKLLVHYKYTIKFNEFIQLHDKINATDNTSSIVKQEGVSWPQIHKQFSSFLFYHTQHLQKLPRVNMDLEFRILTSAVGEVGDDWVSTETMPQTTHLARFKPLQEVSVGFIRFSSSCETDK